MNDNLVPQQTITVQSNFELTPNIVEILKKNIDPSLLKKKNILGQDYIFKVLTRKDWQDHIDSWLEEKRKDPKGISQEDIEKRLIDVSVLFPSLPLTFDNITAKKILFWNNVPAGVQPRLAQLIEHFSGYFVPGIAKEDDAYIEDLEVDLSVETSIPDEVITQVKNQTHLPIRKIRIYNSWWLVRAMTFSEAKLARKYAIENPEADSGIELLTKCVVWGDTSWDTQLAGVVAFLMKQIRDVSGLSDEGSQPIIDAEVEDL